MFLDRVFSIVTNTQNIVNILNSFQEGKLFLQAGSYPIEIVTRKPPVDVWISIVSNGNVPVCNGDVDKVGYTITPTGFILYADVVSDVLEINWNALFSLV